VLHDAMSEGRLTIGELDERLQAVYAAKTIGELEPLTKDLPVPAPLPAHAPQRAINRRIGGTPGSPVSIAILSGSDRRGAWVVPRQYHAVAIMGGIELDLTEARFAERETVINVFAVFGGVGITVPEDVHVRVDGVGIMGAFDNRVRDMAEHPDVSGAPVLRITGLAVMAGVEVKHPKKGKQDRRRLEQ